MAKKRKKAKGMNMKNLSSIIDNGVKITSSIIDVIQTISEQRMKTQELKFNGEKLKADIADKMHQRENETIRIVKGYQLELEKCNVEVVKMQSQSAKDIKEIEERMALNSQNHEYRMSVLRLIEKIIDASTSQYDFYLKQMNSDDIINVTIDINFLEALNKTIKELSGLMLSANVGLIGMSKDED